jgi:trafficking protein particle complex subunit 9
MDISISPSEHVLYEGTLSAIPIGRIDGGASYEFEMPIAFLSCGRFDLSATSFIPGQQAGVGHGQIRAFVK